MNQLFLLFLLNLFFKISYQFQGDGTTYGGQILGGSCGFKNIWSIENKNFKYGVAINSKQYENSLACGKCVNIKYKNQNINAIVVDICPECAYGDLDLFTETYNVLIQEEPGRKPISWDFIDCPSNIISDSIQLRIDELNLYWLNIQPENFKCGFKKMFIKQNNEWIEMIRNDNVMMGLFFNYNKKIDMPIQFKIINEVNEEIITNNFYQLEHLYNLNTQFKCSNINSLEVEINQNANNLDIKSNTPMPSIIDNYQKSESLQNINQNTGSLQDSDNINTILQQNTGSLRGSDANTKIIYEYIDCN
jgi:expansin (peptidoglycan-binding protein)